MKLITFKPRFFNSSKHKKPFSTSQPESPSPSFISTSSDDSVSKSTPKSVLSADADTILTREKLEALLRRLTPTEDEILAMLAEAEAGQITVADLAVLGGTVTEPVGSELQETFAVFDEDGDGRISAQELMGLLVTIGDEECCLEDCRRMIDQVGSGGDGFVGFEDFVRMMGGQT